MTVRSNPGMYGRWRRLFHSPRRIQIRPSTGEVQPQCTLHDQEPLQEFPCPARPLLPAKQRLHAEDDLRSLPASSPPPTPCPSYPELPQTPSPSSFQYLLFLLGLISMLCPVLRPNT